MIMNGVMAVYIRYFAELGSFLGLLRKSGWRYTDTFCEWNV